MQDLGEDSSPHHVWDGAHPSFNRAFPCVSYFLIRSIDRITK